MDKLLFKRILVGALTLLALVYVAYLLISANFDMYPTENAVQVTVTDKIQSNAVIIRDENILENSQSGVLSYSVADGEAVNANGEIAVAKPHRAEKHVGIERNAVVRRQLFVMMPREAVRASHQHAAIIFAQRRDIRVACQFDGPERIRLQRIEPVLLAPLDKDMDTVRLHVVGHLNIVRIAQTNQFHGRLVERNDLRKTAAAAC